MFKPRLNQAQILEYTKGRMGISAVPGSGKTHTLSYLASQLILNGGLENDQEILIVTLVNSAVDNFTTRISGFVRAAGLLDNVGYRVRTLHGLAHDIILERPDLAGLSSQFTIVDEVESDRMIDQITTSYNRLHPELADHLLKSGVDLAQVNHSRNGWPQLITALNQNFIGQAKDLQAEPEDILRKIEHYQYSDVLLEMGVEVYQQYQRGLRYRNALDFSDLIRLAFRVLESDPAFLERRVLHQPAMQRDRRLDRLDPELAQGALDVFGQRLDRLSGDRPLLARPNQPAQDLVAVERLTPAVLLDHDQRRLFQPLVRCEATQARRAFAPPADNLVLLGGTRLKHSGITLAAVWAPHGCPPYRWVRQ